MANTNDFVMFWSPRYFSRLWCVFEVAAFRMYCPRGTMSVHPIELGASYLQGFFLAWGCALVTCTAMLVSAASGVPVYLTLAAVFLLLPPPCFASLRRFKRTQADLRRQLAHFDCEHADCQEQLDRAYIIRSINAWFGSVAAFNQEVRGPLRHAVEAEFLAAPLEYRLALWMTLPACCGVLDVFASSCRSTMASQGKVAAGLYYMTCIFCVFPLFIWSVFWLAERYCERGTSRLAEVAICLALTLALVLEVMFLMVSGMVLYKRSLALALCHTLVCALLTWIAFVVVPRRRRACFVQAHKVSEATSVGSPNNHREPESFAIDDEVWQTTI